MTAPFAMITGMGSAAPERVVTNSDLEATLETSDQWIVERTGIRERRIAKDGETLISLAATASRQAMAQAGITADDIDGIIFATVSADRRLPSAACDLQAELGASKAWAFDVAAACTGWVHGIIAAQGMMATGHGRTILVYGGERLSSIVNWEDRSTAILFGDGGGACILQSAPEGSNRGILSSYLASDGRLADLLYIPEHEDDGVTRGQYIRMAGREVFKHAVLAMAESSDEALKRAGLTGDQIDLLIPHQANLRIIDATARHAGVPMSKVFVNVDQFGNTSAGSIPMAVAQAQAEGRLKPGMIVMLVAFGAGFTWGSVVMRW